MPNRRYPIAPVWPLLAAGLALFLVACGNDSASASQIVAHTDAIWAAYQNGTGGAWTRLESEGGTYRFTVTSNDGRYGFAAVCPSDNAAIGAQVTLDFFTVDEIGGDIWVSCHDYASRPTHTMTVELVGAAADTWLSTNANGTAVPSSSTHTTSVAVREGTTDLLAATGADFSTDFLPTRYVLQRDIPVSGDLAVAVDFGGADAFDADAAVDMGWSGLETGDRIFARFSLQRPNGQAVYATRISEPAWSLAWIPAARLQPGEMGQRSLTVMSRDNEHVASVNDWFVEAPAGNVARPRSFGEVFASAAVTVSPAGGYVPVVRWDAFDDPAYGPAQLYLFATEGDADEAAWVVRLTPGWLGDADRYTFTAPDLSRVAGWQAAWTPVHGATRDYVWLGAETSNVGMGEFYRRRGMNEDMAGVDLVYTRTLALVYP